MMGRMGAPAHSGSESRPERRPKRDDGHTAERESLGRAIRELRLSQGRTLASVAAEAGVSVSLLSQVETGQTDPSLDSLRDIADALGTAPFKLLAEQPVLSGLVRAGEGKQLALPDSTVSVELLSPSMAGPFEVIRWTVEVDGVTALSPRGHGGVETTVLLSGLVRVEIGSETVTLRPGDALTAEAKIPHRTVNLSDEPAEGISIISPPLY
jgi:transcriptional regulator with XRE-family HTH domain